MGCFPVTLSLFTQPVNGHPAQHRCREQRLYPSKVGHAPMESFVDDVIATTHRRAQLMRDLKDALLRDNLVELRRVTAVLCGVQLTTCFGLERYLNTEWLRAL